MTQKNTIIAIIVGILLIGLGIYFFSADDVDQDIVMNTEIASTTSQSTTSTSATPNATTPPEPTISAVMLSENEAGPVMDVQYANLTQDGFIALYNVDSRGEVSLVGSSDLLEADIYQNLKIQTTVSLIQDQSLVAVLFTDTNSDGKFTPQVDDKAVRVNGIIVTDIDIVGRATTAETATQLTQVKTAIAENMTE